LTNRQWLLVRAPVLLLALALAASGALLLHYDSHLTFIADDWNLLVVRHGSSPEVFLEPFKENIVVAAVAIYKLLLGLFGLDSALPYYAVTISLFLASAVLLFLYMRRRVGDWLALIGAVLLLFLGAAFEDFFWIIQMVFFGAMAAGLGMLLALERESRGGDRVACGLLTVALAFSSLGLVFLAGAAVEILLGARARARRAYVVLLPLALYATWWLGWGRSAKSSFSLGNVEHLPGYVFDAAGAGVISLFGLATGTGAEPEQPHLIIGKLVFLAAIGAGAVLLARRRRVPRGLAVALALALAFWVLSGLNRNPERFPTSSRYQYASAVFLLLVAAEALRGFRLPRLAAVLAAALAALAVWGGVSMMNRMYDEHWHPDAEAIRTQLAAVEVAGPSARPGFRISFPPSAFFSVGSYLTVVREHGSPAFSETQLAARPLAKRRRADLTLAKSLGLALVPLERGTDPAAGCRAPDATARRSGVRLGPGELRLANRGDRRVRILLGRFSDHFPVRLGAVPPGAVASLDLPADRSPRPWKMKLAGGPVLLCAGAL
jgi:hypothetical protein